MISILSNSYNGGIEGILTVQGLEVYLASKVVTS